MFLSRHLTYEQEKPFPSHQPHAPSQLLLRFHRSDLGYMAVLMPVMGRKAETTQHSQGLEWVQCPLIDDPKEKNKGLFCGFLWILVCIYDLALISL